MCISINYFFFFFLHSVLQLDEAVHVTESTPYVPVEYSNEKRDYQDVRLEKDKTWKVALFPRVVFFIQCIICSINLIIVFVISAKTQTKLP